MFPYATKVSCSWPAGRSILLTDVLLMFYCSWPAGQSILLTDVLLMYY